MTPDAQREYVRRWVETGRLVEEIRWSELRRLDARAALRASDHLIEAALLVPLPASRLEWSGLVEFQDALRARR